MHLEQILIVSPFYVIVNMIKKNEKKATNVQRVTTLEQNTF